MYKEKKINTKTEKETLATIQNVSFVFEILYPISAFSLLYTYTHRHYLPAVSNKS